jgi:hypothetical protein
MARQFTGGNAAIEASVLVHPPLLFKAQRQPRSKIPTLAAKTAARMGHPIHLHSNNCYTSP